MPDGSTCLLTSCRTDFGGRGSPLSAVVLIYRNCSQTSPDVSQGISRAAIRYSPNVFIMGIGLILDGVLLPHRCDGIP